MKRSLIIISIFICVVVAVISIVIFLFPRKYLNIINVYAEKYSLSKSMIASVINIESGYDKDCVSNAGAIGLMQLLPSTAFDCANRLDMVITEKDLYNPEININLGCYYLSYLLDMFDGNLENSLSAYNWGLGNVKNWIALGNIDDNGTVTNIPVEETVGYIRKYNASYFVYENFYKYN